MLLTPAAFAPEARAVDPVEIEPRTAVDFRLRVVLAGIAVVLVAASMQFGLGLLWAGGLAFVFVASIVAALRPPGAIAVSARTRDEVLLWLLAAASAGLTLAVHRPDPDEPFYLNLAAAAADFPRAPLLRFDSIHGIPGILLPAYYRVSSIETLSGAISYLLDIEPIVVAHLAFAAIAGLLLPLALARALRILTPAAWLWAVLAVLAVYVLDGSKHRGYGNFAFVRLYQGKAMFVTVAIPLIIAYGIEFGLAPSRRAFARLAAAQICAIGLTSTALWCAPLVACLSVMAVLRFRMRDLGTLALGVASSTWVIGMALWTRAAMSAASHSSGGAASAASAAGLQLSKLPAQAMRIAVGEVQSVSAYALLLFLACVLARTSTARRVACLFSLVFFAICVNPMLASFVAKNITGEATYWRVLWALPMPLFASIALTAPVPDVAGRRKRLWGVTTAVALVAAFLVVVPLRASISSRNRTRLDWPGLKVPKAYDAAREIVRYLPRHRTVLAPRNVSMWLPTFRNYVYPVLARPTWLKGRVLRERHMALMRCTRGASRGCSGPTFASALTRAGVDAVALRKVHGRHALVRARVMHAAGFKRMLRSQKLALELWIRVRSTSGARTGRHLAQEFESPLGLATTQPIPLRNVRKLAGAFGCQMRSSKALSGVGEYSEIALRNSAASRTSVATPAATSPAHWSCPDRPTTNTGRRKASASYTAVDPTPTTNRERVNESYRPMSLGSSTSMPDSSSHG